jgi:hypothetical protein
MVPARAVSEPVVPLLSSVLIKNSGLEERSEDEQDHTRNIINGDNEILASAEERINLDNFDLGPNIEVPKEYTAPLSHPGSVKHLSILTARTSFHEHVPEQPGQHGILYLDYEDIPKYLVMIFKSKLL